MGWGAALKLRTVLENLARILAIETLCASRGLALRAPLLPADGTGGVMRRVFAQVGGLGPDRLVAPDLASIEALVVNGDILATAQTAVGPLE